MAIVKNSVRDSRLDGEFSPSGSSSSSSSSEGESDGEVRSETSSSDSDASDVDSGMDTDEVDITELGEPGTELCQVGNQTFSVPMDLYDLPVLTSVLSVETWNDCLCEDERFALAQYLPDMDQENFGRTLRELFSSNNFHFGSPLQSLFDRLKGGLCDPRVVLYRRGLISFQKREHYHRLRKYQNAMVGSLSRIRDAWQNCSAYGIEERLRLLNIMRSQKVLGYDRDGVVGSKTDSESENSGERFWNRKLKKDRRALEQVSYGKENGKGILKVTPPKVSAKKEYLREALDHFPLSVKHGLEKSKASKALLGYLKQEQVAGYDLGVGRKIRKQTRGGDGGDEGLEQDYGMDIQGDWSATRGSSVAKASLLKPGKKQEFSRTYDRGKESRFANEEPEDYAGSQYHGRGRTSNQGVTIASYDRHSIDSMKKGHYPEKEWMYPPKDRGHQGVKGAQTNWAAGIQSHRGSKIREEANSPELPVKVEWNTRGKKSKAEDGFRSGKSKIGFDSKVRSHTAAPDSYFHSGDRAKIRGRSSQNEGIGMGYSRGSAVFAQNEETESDSSEEENREVNRFAGYPSVDMEDHLSRVGKPIYDSKKHGKLAKPDKKVYSQFLDGGRSSGLSAVEPYSIKGKQKGKIYEPDNMHDIKLMKKSQMPRPIEKSQSPLMKSYNIGKKRKATVGLDHSSEQSYYMHNYGSDIFEEHEGYLEGDSMLLDGETQMNRSANRRLVTDAYTADVDCSERPNMPLQGCNSVMKKRKGKADGAYVDEPVETACLQSIPKHQIDESMLTKKKGKRKSDPRTSPLSIVAPEPIIPEKETAQTVDTELDTRPPKKPFTLITPTKHTGFSFSIIHLLSAVRKAMITPHTEDTAEISSHIEKKRNEENKAYPTNSQENMDANTSEHAGQNNLPSLAVQEIVNRVRSNPGDPCILETQEPLQDLVRGVLKIFSSKTAPLGAKGWKTLVIYEKSNKGWTWIGPVSSSSSDDTIEEETSAEAWDIPHKMLVKLVDAFANWLKAGQETLQQIGSLPAPPIALLPNLDEKERFRDLRAQKSLNTISPSSEEVREYFRREEFLRYSVPDRAFSYTAADGKKSIVAPLRRGGGKPTSKARDHFMLKPDRPPHVTILCLVRDAAARLPGSIGTRADVCTLIRDSQYIVEDVSDAQVNQVVSGALDRLHYERDPCVQFDGDRKLWVYLHRDREEEDFEDDGTSSTKKWKRQRKDATDVSDTAAANDVSCPVIGDPSGNGSTGYGLHPDLNVDASSMHSGVMNDSVYNGASSMHAGVMNDSIYNGLRPTTAGIQPYTEVPPDDRNRGNPVCWEGLGLNALRESKMLCQENSTNEDFEDDAFSRERAVGLLDTSFL